MELLKREVKSLPRIQLKALSCWLINENRLEKQQETGNKQGSIIVITIKGETKVRQHYISGLRFGGVIKVVERYWEARLSLVYMKCYSIGHEQMGNGGNWPPKCVICAGFHKVEDHYCGVMGCNKGKGKICIHITIKYANCVGSYTANSLRYISKHKTDTKTRKEKKIKEKRGKEKVQVYNANNKSEDEKREKNLPADIEMDLKNKRWAQSPGAEGSEFYDDESQNHTKKN